MSAVNEQVTEQVTEQIADHLEEVARVTRHLSGREIGFFIAGAGLGIAGGFAFGYFVAGKRLETKYSKLADEEISQMREHYHEKVVALDAQAQRRRPLEEVVVERGYTQADQSSYSEAEYQAIAEANAKYPAAGEETPPQVIVETETVNVFTSGSESGSEWNYEVELQGRSPEVPYVIHYDEYIENEPLNEQVSYTYYEQDDMMIDSRGEQIDQDEVVGLGNLGKWGHGSHDPNVVYVRNEELSLDIEIVRDTGSYEESTGKTIRHSATRTHRRSSRRFDDESS